MSLYDLWTAEANTGGLSGSVPESPYQFTGSLGDNAGLLDASVAPDSFVPSALTQYESPDLSVDTPDWLQEVDYTASFSKPEEPWSFTKMASDMWKSVTTDKATAAVTMAVISGAAKGVLDLMAVNKKSSAEATLKQAEWANTEKVDADKRKRIGSIPTLSRKAAYAPIAQNYSAPGLLNLNRGSV